MQQDRLIIRPATDGDLPDLGRLGAALVDQHHRFDPARFVSPAHAEATYGEFLRAQMHARGAVVLVAAPFAVAATARSALAGLRDGLPPVSLRTLLGGQTALFAAVELGGHAAAGLSPACG